MKKPYQVPRFISLLMDTEQLIAQSPNNTIPTKPSLEGNGGEDNRVQGFFDDHDWDE